MSFSHYLAKKHIILLIKYNTNLFSIYKIPIIILLLKLKFFLNVKVKQPDN